MAFLEMVTESMKNTDTKTQTFISIQWNNMITTPYKSSISLRLPKITFPLLPFYLQNSYANLGLTFFA